MRRLTAACRAQIQIRNRIRMRYCMRLCRRTDKSTGASGGSSTASVRSGERPSRSRRQGIPLGGIWIASKLAGTNRDLTLSLAVFIATGIIVSYWLALLVASWIRGRTGTSVKSAPG